MKVAREPNERVNRRLLGQFIETLLGLFLVVFVVASVLSPAAPLVFVLILIPGWLVGVPVAYALVYRRGYAWLAGSGFYDPGVLGDRRAVLWFGATAILAKLLLLGLLAVTPIRSGPIDGVVLGLFALAVAYALVYRRGYDRLGVVR